MKEGHFMKTNQTGTLGSHHIAVRASDFDRSLQFYTEGLGMTVVAAWGEGDQRAAMLNIGDGVCIELFAGGKANEKPPQEATDTGILHLAFDTESPDECYERAIAAGAKPHTEPTSLTLDAKPNPMRLRIAFVSGPDGELLEFFHQK